jgi:hypothetical protein
MASIPFIETIRAQFTGQHPHVAPMNKSALQSDHATVTAKFQSLLGYQKYLASARQAKAQQQGSSPSFERTVLANAQQALADIGALSGSALRIVQQVNHTGLWTSIHGSVTSSLQANGPVTLKQLWDEVQQIAQNPQYAPAFTNAGLTSDISAQVADAITKANATLVLQGGQVAIEAQPAGSPTGRVLLKVPGTPATGIGDLLRHQQFDQVVSAFTNNGPLYMEAVPTSESVSYEPSYLFALGAVAAQQRVAAHVRKLKDTGLATYQGNDPVSDFILAIFVVGMVLAALGSLILYLCDDPPGNVTPPDEACFAGFLMAFLASVLLGVTVVIGGGGVLALVALFGFGVTLIEWWENLPTFNPQPAPTGS